MSLDEVMEAVELVLEDIDTLGMEGRSMERLLSLMEERVFKVGSTMMNANEVYVGDKAYNTKCSDILAEHPWIGDTMYEIKN